MEESVESFLRMVHTMPQLLLGMQDMCDIEESVFIKTGWRFSRKKLKLVRIHNGVLSVRKDLDAKVEMKMTLTQSAFANRSCDPLEVTSLKAGSWTILRISLESGPKLFLYFRVSQEAAKWALILRKVPSTSSGKSSATARK